MRIDTVQAQPIPQIPQVATDNPASEKARNQTNTQSDGNFDQNKKDSSSATQAVEKVQKELRNSIKQIVDSIDEDNTSLKFHINDKTHRIIIQVVNTKSKKVVREIPPEKMVEMMASLCKLIGINVDEKA